MAHISYTSIQSKWYHEIYAPCTVHKPHGTICVPHGSLSTVHKPRGTICFSKRTIGRICSTYVPKSCEFL